MFRLVLRAYKMNSKDQHFFIVWHSLIARKVG